MKITGKVLKSVLAVGVIIVVSLTVLGIVSGTRSPKKGQANEKQVTDKLPPVISKVKGLKVIDAGIKNQGQPDAECYLVVRNKTNVGVTAFTVSNGDLSIGKDGGLLTDNPMVIIEPHGEMTVSFPLSNLEKDVPVVITGVFYKDSSEEGVPDVIKMMHEYRAKEKEKRDAKKGGSNQ